MTSALASVEALLCLINESGANVRHLMECGPQILPHLRPPRPPTQCTETMNITNCTVCVIFTYLTNRHRGDLLYHWLCFSSACPGSRHDMSYNRLFCIHPVFLIMDIKHFHSVWICSQCSLLNSEASIVKRILFHFQAFISCAFTL